MKKLLFTLLAGLIGISSYSQSILSNSNCSLLTTVSLGLLWGQEETPHIDPFNKDR